jgi:hypothetical protein
VVTKTKEAAASARSAMNARNEVAQAAIKQQLTPGDRKAGQRPQARGRQPQEFGRGVPGLALKRARGRACRRSEHERGHRGTALRASRKTSARETGIIGGSNAQLHSCGLRHGRQGL